MIQLVPMERPGSNMTKNQPRLTLGPNLFNWPADEKRDFYFRIADEASIDTVYIGEVVCSKRQPFFDPLIPEIVERLQAAGKEVIFSTLALIMNPREMKAIREGCLDSEILVEANDLSSAAMLKGKPHVIGPFVNTYNEGTLAYLVRNGASRVVLPGELSGSSIKALAAAGSEAELEVQVFGRLPLAISARCYHARSQGLHKDSCQFVCDQDYDGMDLETLEGKDFLSVNGTQTLSHTYCNLMSEIPEMQRAGINAFRLSPHSFDMVGVAKIYRQVLNENLAPGEANAKLQELTEGVTYSNGFYHGQEGVQNVHQSAE